MMRYNNIINGLLAIASILAFTACAEDTAYDDNVAEGNGVFDFPVLQAYIQERTHLLITKNNLKQAPNTSYSLSKLEIGAQITFRKIQAKMR